MDKKHDEFVGVDSLHAAVVNVDTEAEYSADKPEYLAPTAEITGSAEVENKPTYYDNVAANNYITEGVTTLNITISGVHAEVAAKYLGKKFDAATGRVYDDGKPNPPDVALSFRFNKGKNEYRYYQYLKGTFSGGAEEASSKSNSIDVKTYQMTFTAVTTTHKWTIDEVLKALKRIYGDTTDEALDVSTWFNAVQTPDTAVSPSALSMESSVPADEATGVAVDSDITLTFNNKISDQVITLFSDAFAAVAATITKDSTGKILTVSPDSNLDASTSYNLIMTSVTDIYGQKLENQVIEFTTSA